MRGWLGSVRARARLPRRQARADGALGRGRGMEPVFKKVLIVGEGGREHVASLSLEGLERVSEVCTWIVGTQ